MKAMSEKNNNTQEQKPKIYKMAIVSPVLIVVGFLMLGIFSTWLKGVSSLLAHLGYYSFLLLTPVGFVLGIFADYRIYKSKGMLKGRVFAILGIMLGLLGIAHILI